MVRADTLRAGSGGGSGASRAGSGGQDDPLSLKPVPFEQAIQAARERGIVLPEVYYGQLQGIARGLAFSIAGIAKLDQLAQVRDSLAKALEQGQNFRQWQEELLKAPDVLALPRHRLDNIFRTNIQGSYARGRCAHIDRHRETRPYLMYSAINDSRVRPAHLAMDGFVAEVGHEIWKTWTPPCGYRCRCSIVSLTEKQAQRYRAADAERMVDPVALQAREDAMSGGPDDGWDYSPCDDADEGLIRALLDKGVDLPPSLADKVAQMQKEALIARSADPDTWVQIEAAKGSNAGGIYEAPDGSRFYVKLYSNPEQARSEYVANEMMRLMGLEAPESRLVMMKLPGRDRRALAFVSRWRDDITSASPDELAEHEDIAKVLVANALVANRGVAGLTYDNLLMTKGGRLIVIDTGGSFQFRAQGGPKKYLPGMVEEMTTLRDPNINAQSARVFKRVSDDGIRQALAVLHKIESQEQVKEVFLRSGTRDDVASSMADILWARRQWILDTWTKKAAPKKRGARKVSVAKYREAFAKFFGEDNAEADIDPSINAGRRFAQRYGINRDDDVDTFLGAVNLYTGKYCKKLNRYLRGALAGFPDDYLDAGKTVAAALTQGLALIEENFTGVVRRGVDLDDEDVARLVSTCRKAAQTGKPVAFNGFLSTSKATGYSGNVRLHIKANGLQGKYVAELSRHEAEQEVLFGHGSRFRVLDILEKVEPGESDYTVDIHLEETVEALEAPASDVATLALPAQLG